MALVGCPNYAFIRQFPTSMHSSTTCTVHNDLCMMESVLRGKTPLVPDVAAISRKDGLDWYAKEPHLMDTDLCTYGGYPLAKETASTIGGQKLQATAAAMAMVQGTTVTAPGKDDPACAGLRKQPETASHKVVAGMECNSGDAMCDAMKATTNFQRQPNDCWWAEARADGQFRIPHSENCLGFVDCSINLEDSELIFNDESRTNFETNCPGPGGGGGGSGGDGDIKDAIWEQSIKCQTRKSGSGLSQSWRTNCRTPEVERRRLPSSPLAESSRSFSF